MSEVADSSGLESGCGFLRMCNMASTMRQRLRFAFSWPARGRLELN